MTSALTRRALAEFVGTAFLVAAVIGSGIAAVRLSPNDVGLQLLENSVITGAALVALILALQPVSAAFNPIVTLVERALGAVSSRDAAVLIITQVAGGFVGAVVANLVFDLETDHDRPQQQEQQAAAESSDGVVAGGGEVVVGGRADHQCRRDRPRWNG